MGIFWREALKGGRFVIVFSDPYSADEAEGVLREIFTRGGGARPLRVLVDARHSAAPSPPFVRRAATFWSAHIEEMRGAKLAVVVATDAQFGMARMAQISVEVSELPFALRAFRDWADAEGWLDSASE